MELKLLVSRCTIANDLIRGSCNNFLNADKSSFDNDQTVTG